MIPFCLRSSANATASLIVVIALSVWGMPEMRQLHWSHWWLAFWWAVIVVTSLSAISTYYVTIRVICGAKQLDKNPEYRPSEREKKAGVWFLRYFGGFDVEKYEQNLQKKNPAA